MTTRFPFVLHASMLSLAIAGFAAEASAGQNVFSVSGSNVQINGKPFKVIGLRLSNGLVSDAKAQELIANLDVFKSYGINTFSVFFMGSRFGDVKGYLPDATIDPTYAARMAKIIEAADARGMVVLVGCLYWGTSTAMDGLVGWTQTQANQAIANTVTWLKTNSYRNVFLDPDNEGMSPFTDAPLIAAGHAVDPSMMIACNRGSASVGGGSPTDCEASSDLNIHYGAKVAGKPWLESEGVPDSANYWGAYSKTANYDNYIRIGLYTSAYKALAISDAKDAIDNNAGYVLASTWLQCGPGQGIGGPFMTPGGYSNVADVNANTMAVNPDAGVKWWLEAMQAAYGAWGSAGSDGGTPDAESAGAGGASGAGGAAGTGDAAVGDGGPGLAQDTPADAGCSCDLGARSDKPGFGLASILVLALGLVLRHDSGNHPRHPGIDRQCRVHRRRDRSRARGSGNRWPAAARAKATVRRDGQAGSRVVRRSRWCRRLASRINAWAAAAPWRRA